METAFPPVSSMRGTVVIATTVGTGEGGDPASRGAVRGDTCQEEECPGPDELTPGNLPLAKPGTFSWKAVYKPAVHGIGTPNTRSLSYAPKRKHGFFQETAPGRVSPEPVSS